MKAKKILDTDIVRIVLTDEGYNVFIKMQNGSWLEHAPFEGDLKGLVNALDLAVNCCAGKFYPRRLASKLLEDKADRKRLELY
jgi:hypothetical protein